VAGPTTESAAAAVRALVAELESERDALADAVVERIREAVPEFRRLPRGTLRSAVQDTMGRELAWAGRYLLPWAFVQLVPRANAGSRHAKPSVLQRVERPFSSRDSPHA